MSSPATSAPTGLAGFGAQLLSQLATLALMAGLLAAYHHHFAPKPAPDPVDVAAREYLKAVSAAFKGTAADVRSGSADKGGFDKSLNARVGPAARSLASAIQAAPSLPAALDRVGAVIGGE